ncbi:MAG: cytidylate kinase-like family protein [Anaerolineae bacterium]|jgi:cytidylate kinase|nr:cytidylate kinase-like family protein [Anaerolineae bacterium]MBT7192185.1 cytidylate kinase-like family protein [Anaerolineae bacterium]MBT7990661.1 cytidylate kinase-like family protein [Anaerolineae bacterium]
MAVLTISRKLGSNGNKIAKAVAEKLGYRLIDKDFIGAVLEEYGLVEFDREYDHLPSIWERLDLEKKERREVLVGMIQRVVRALAKMDNMVILGRSGYLILNEYANVLNVRIHAPMLHRAAQIATEKGISVEEAEEIATQSDKVSANFVETFYGIDWDDTRTFDFVINGEKIPAEFVANNLVKATRYIEEKELDSAKTTASIKEEATLRSVILEQFE